MKDDSVDLVAVGSIALDDIKTPSGEVSSVLGGSNTYFSVGASFFSRVGIVGIVGKDFPQSYMSFLSSRGVDLKGLVKSDGKTFRYSCAYNHDMNQRQTLKTELNSFESFNPKLPEDYKKANYIFLGNISPELQLNVLRQAKKPRLVAADSMNLWIDNSRDLLIEVIKKVDLLLLNEWEIRQLFSTTNIVKAARSAMNLGPEHVIVKKGEHGAVLFSGNGRFVAPGYPLENVVDPTGSGDCFAGGFMGWLAKTNDLSEQNLRRAVIYGSCVASFNAEGFSLDKLKNINIEDIQNRYTEFRNLIDF